MLERLTTALDRNTPITGADLCFYLHELAEAALMDKLLLHDPTVSALLGEFPDGLIVNDMYFTDTELDALATNDPRINDLKQTLHNHIVYKYAHYTTLDRYEVSQFSLYHADVITQLPSFFSVGYFQFWNI